MIRKNDCLKMIQKLISHILPVQIVIGTRYNGSSWESTYAVYVKR